MAYVVDESTGELVITATLAGVGDQGPVVTALRMDMALAQQLRAMAGFFKGEHLVDGSGGSDCYDCRTTGERLAVQEDRLQILSDTMRRIVAEIDQRLYDEEKATALHNQRLNAITKRLEALETKNASATVHLNLVPGAVRRIDELERQIKNLAAATNWDRVMGLLQQLESHPTGHLHDGGQWITCPQCQDVGTVYLDGEDTACPMCEGKGRIWEMPPEDGA